MGRVGYWDSPTQRLSTPLRWPSPSRTTSSGADLGRDPDAGVSGSLSAGGDGPGARGKPVLALSSTIGTAHLPGRSDRPCAQARQGG